MNQKKKSSWNWTILISLIKSEKGFSLAEVMVAAGMLGILSLGVTQLMQNSSKTEKRLAQSINLSQIESEIATSLRDSLACRRTFKAFNLIDTAPSAPVNAETPHTIGTAIYPSPPPMDGTLPAAAILAPSWASGAGAQPPSVYLGRLASEVDPANWPTVIEMGGVYGAGSNALTVQNIIIQGYVNGAYDGSGPPTVLDLTARDLIAGSNLNPGGPWYQARAVLRVDFLRGRRNASVANNQAGNDILDEKLKNTTFGQLFISRFYPVNLIVNEANQVVDCYANQDQAVERNCNSLGGTLNEASGRCTGIKITNAGPVDTLNTWSMEIDRGWAPNSAADNMAGGLVVEKSMAVGVQSTALTPDQLGDGNAYILNGLLIGDRLSGNFTGITALPTATDLTTIPAGDAYIANDINIGNNADILNDANVNNNLNVTNEATVTNNTFLRRNLRVGAGNSPVDYDDAGDASVQNELQVGARLTVGVPLNPLLPGSALSVGIGNATVGNNLNVRSNTSIGTTAIDATNMLRVEGDSSLFVNGTSQLVINNNNVSDGVVRINQGAVVPFRIDEGTTQVMRVLDSGEIQVFSGGALTTSVGAGVSPSNYRPVIIRNQPYLNNTTDYDIPTSSVGYEAATKYWVRRMVFGTFYENNQAKIEDILNNMAEYAQHNRLDSLVGAVCTDLQLQVGNTGFRSNCTMVSGKCVCSQSECSNNTGTRVCNNMVLSGSFRADGTVTAGTNLIVGGTGSIGSSLTVGTTITAGGTITGARVEAIDWSRAARIYISSVTAPAAGFIKGPNLWATTRVTSPRVCSSAAAGGTDNTACYTRFGKVTCDGGGFIIGIAYGRPICALSGANSSGAAIPVTWH